MLRKLVLIAVLVLSVVPAYSIEAGTHKVRNPGWLECTDEVYYPEHPCLSQPEHEKGRDIEWGK